MDGPGGRAAGKVMYEKKTQTEKVDPGESQTMNLPASFFGVVRLAGVRVRIWCRRLFHNGALFVARGRPPAILVLRQLAHLRALPGPGSMVAMAITHRRLGSRHQSWRLVGERSPRGGSQKYSDSNHLADSVGLECHISFWRGKKGAPIARRMGFFGIGVVAVPVP